MYKVKKPFWLCCVCGVRKWVASVCLGLILIKSDIVIWFRVFGSADELSPPILRAFLLNSLAICGESHVKLLLIL